jgi:N-methylhydantoinase A/oxoprolinase/acetone carboxylase beta subunit
MFIGIDVGGTNTDAAVVGEEEIVSIKVPNEKGLGAIFRELKGWLSDSRVVVSTSLPLNLLLSRAEEHPTCTILVPGPGLNYQSFGKVVRGFVNHRGDVVEEIDESEVESILKNSNSKNVAIASKFSVRNSEIESKIMNIAERFFPSYCISLSHHVGGMIYPYRINTTVVNAKIRETVFSLTDTIREFVSEFFYYKGDGGIIPYQIALNNPSELYNSSSAAVAIGAFFLTREKDALVVDIGGTTTDFVMIEDGVPKILDCVEILGKKTLVRCVDSFSIPFGGDSVVEDGVLKPLRRGKSIAFGGENLTLTDMLNAEGYEIGDYESSRKAVNASGANPEGIIERFVDMVSKSVDSVDAERVILTGYLAEYLSETISKKIKVNTIVPEHSSAVNAVGVAVSRVSLTLYVRFDTETDRAIYNGVVEKSPFPQASLPSDDEMVEKAEEKLISVLSEYGYIEESVKLIYFNSYTVVRGGIKRGKIADIIVQVEPGVSRELLDM